jgi:hypothetical protein
MSAFTSLAAVIAGLGDSLRAARSGYDRRVAAVRVAAGDAAAFDSAWQKAVA